MKAFEELKYYTAGFTALVAVDYTHYVGQADLFIKFLLGAAMLIYTVARIYILIMNYKYPKNKKDESEQKED